MHIRSPKETSNFLTNRLTWQSGYQSQYDMDWDAGISQCWTSLLQYSALLESYKTLPAFSSDRTTKMKTSRRTKTNSFKQGLRYLYLLVNLEGCRRSMQQELGVSERSRRKSVTDVEMADAELFGYWLLEHSYSAMRLKDILLFPHTEHNPCPLERRTS